MEYTVYKPKIPAKVFLVKIRKNISWVECWVESPSQPLFNNGCEGD